MGLFHGLTWFCFRLGLVRRDGIQQKSSTRLKNLQLWKFMSQSLYCEVKDLAKVTQLVGGQARDGTKHPTIALIKPHSVTSAWKPSQLHVASTVRDRVVTSC